MEIQRTSKKRKQKWDGKWIKGLIHIHSDFSYDGYDSIPNIVGFLKRRGYSFACLTEHDDYFDNDKMERYVNVCRHASGTSFQVIPGLEFRCKNKVHILGIGIKEYFHADEPVDATKKIKEQGGLAIIAHPVGYLNNITDELLDTVDGIEIWNGQKDSRFIPHYKMLVYYRKLKSKYPHIKASCGSDMHSLSHYYEMDTIAQSFSGNIKSIWGKSNPEMQGKYLALSVNREGSLFSVITLVFMRGILNVVKSFRNLLIKPDSYK